MANVHISGKWLFNKTPEISGNTSFGYAFSSNGISFVGMAVSSTWIKYSKAGGNYITVYADDDGDGVFSWSNENYRLVDFGESGLNVIDIFYNTLTACAKPYVEPTTTTITYNGNTLAELEEGQTANFDCNGKKAAGNVSILFGSKGSITYKGVTTEIEKGKTANLLCAGKKFATDVVVAVEKAVVEPTADNLFGVWKLNNTLTYTAGMTQTDTYRYNVACYVLEGNYAGWQVYNITIWTLSKNIAVTFNFVDHGGATVYMNGSWQEPDCKTLDFGTSGQSVPQAFFDWLKANAIKR